MSQITKPMALDETLQDVVTAIQGITQGGMIVSTGTVGSSTQPVYINGGVPTQIGHDVAGIKVLYNTITDLNDVPTYPGIYNVYIASGVNALHTPGHTSSASSYYSILVMGTSSEWASSASTRVTQIAIQHYSSQPTYNEVWMRYKHDNLWVAWSRMCGGIVTGTATDPNANVRIDSGFVSRRGNVVTFRYRIDVTTAFTPGDGTVMFKLPWGAYDWIFVPRYTGTAWNNITEVGNSGIRANGEVTFGTGPYRQLAVGEKMWLSGTYTTGT